MKDFHRVFKNRDGNEFGDNIDDSSTISTVDTTYQYENSTLMDELMEDCIKEEIEEENIAISIGK